MNNKEKIKDILINKLDYCDCDNCKYSDWDKYHDSHCSDCYRKYQNWSLSIETATEIAEQIIKEVINSVE